MKRFSLAAVIAMAVGTLAGPAQAQIVYPYMPPQYGPFYQTQLSPWLNFLRGGDPAANYFLGVLPEFQRREYNHLFRAQIGQLQILTAPLANPLSEPLELARLPRRLGPSGHPTSFGYTATFFPAPPAGAAQRRGQPYAAPEGSAFRR